jgi:catechol 2,3-dioxygenase-like lactoylglutathione lyase family enzyme
MLLVIAFSAPGLAQSAAKPMAFDHVHLLVPDPARAYEWYAEHLKGVQAEFPGRLAWEPWSGREPMPVQLLFTRQDGAAPSEGGAIERLGFSVASLAATMDSLMRASVTIVEPIQRNPGAWPRAVIKDPWGVTIELVEDSDMLGFHHVSLRVADPEATLKWYAAAFGGDQVAIGTSVAVKYRGMYLMALRDATAALSRGRAIDHISWGPADIHATVADLQTRGAQVGTEPRGPNNFGHLTAFVNGPGGVYIELVQHLELTKQR